MSNTIQVLEFIKYLTVKGQLDNVKRKVGFRGSGEMAVYISGSSGGTTLNMPEGLTIDFRLINVHWGALFLNVWNDDKNSDSFSFEFSNGSNGHIKKNLDRVLSFNGESYVMYVFYSDYYKELKQSNPNQVMTLINEVDSSNFRNLNQERYFPFSMVMTVKNEPQNIQNFEEFMNMDYADWGLSFNFHRSRFLQYNDLTLFEKYDVKILVDYLENVKLIEILKNICDGWTNGIIPQNVRRDLLLGILSEIKTENAKDIYDEFFMTPSPLFYNSILNNLDSDDKIQFIFLLLKLFYKQMSQQDLDLYKNFVENLPVDHIVPFINETRRVSGVSVAVDRGPFPEIEVSNSGILIKKIRFKTYTAGAPSSKELVGSENPFNYLENKNYAFSEIIGALACFNNQDAGFMQLMVYPIPSFAYEVFHNNFSKRYSFTNLINELGVAACIIFPYFRIVQFEAIASNIISLVFGGIGAILTDDFKNYLINYPVQGDPNGYGKLFVNMYIFFSSFWVTKDLTIVFSEGGLKAFIDTENLLSIWGLYQNTQGFIDVQQVLPEDSEKVIKFMNKARIYYDDYKKKH